MWLEISICCNRLLGLFKGQKITNIPCHANSLLPSALLEDVMTLGDLVVVFSRLLVRSFNDFSSIFEEIAFSRKSLVAILDPNSLLTVEKCGMSVVERWGRDSPDTVLETLVQRKEICESFCPLLFCCISSSLLLQLNSPSEHNYIQHLQKCNKSYFLVLWIWIFSDLSVSWTINQPLPFINN